MRGAADCYELYHTPAQLPRCRAQQDQGEALHVPLQLGVLGLKLRIWHFMSLALTRIARLQAG